MGSHQTAYLLNICLWHVELHFFKIPANKGTELNMRMYRLVSMVLFASNKKNNNRFSLGDAHIILILD